MSPEPASELVQVVPPVDPWRAVRRTGLRASRNGLSLGLVIAMLTHGVALAKPMLALNDMLSGVTDMREELSSYFWNTYEIDVVEDDKPDDKPEDKPEPEPEPAPLDEPDPVEPSTLPEVPPPDTPPEDVDPYQEDEPPPAAAKAADVLTASDEAEDLSGDGYEIVDNDGSDAMGTGYSSGKGTEDTHVGNKNAKSFGTPGATGTATTRPPPRPPPTKDLSAKPVLLNIATVRNCGFPPQADLAQVDRAVVTVSVTVGPDGSVRSSSAASDPGYGFGARAAQCARRAKFKPALDRFGRPTTSRTAFRINFSRR